MVPLNQVKERVLVELSAAFAQQLRAQRSDLRGLSFFCEESAQARRLDFSKLINRLKGNWKISNNAKTTNFIIVDQNIFKGRETRIPAFLEDTIHHIYRKAEEYIATSYSSAQLQNNLKHNHQQSLSTSSIQDGSQQNTTSGSLLGRTQHTQLRTAFPQNLSSKADPRSKPQAVPIAILKSWLPLVDQISLFGRQILADDLDKALKFLESQTAAFHTSRMRTLLLERDQLKPATFSDEGAFFVISKLPDDKVPNSKQPNVQQQIRDITNRQTFHEFDKLQMMPLAPGAGNTTGLSPAKSHMQVAMAQEKIQEAKYNGKASPLGYLNGRVDTERQAKIRLRQQYNIHKFTKETPNGYCPCLTKTEKVFVNQNFNRIEKTRERENYKNLQKAVEANNDIQDWHNATLLEPIPNEQHTYCQVCMETYDNYLDHIQNSATHKKRAKIQDGPFAEIDIIADDLNKKQKWVYKWKAEPIVDHQMMSLTGYSQYSQLFSQNFNEQLQQCSVSPRYSHSMSKKKKSVKPPTPFKLRAPSAANNNQARLQQNNNSVVTGQNNVNVIVQHNRASVIRIEQSSSQGCNPNSQTDKQPTQAPLGVTYHSQSVPWPQPIVEVVAAPSLQERQEQHQERASVLSQSQQQTQQQVVIETPAKNSYVSGAEDRRSTPDKRGDLNDDQEKDLSSSPQISLQSAKKQLWSNIQQSQDQDRQMVPNNLTEKSQSIGAVEQPQVQQFATQDVFDTQEQNIANDQEAQSDNDCDYISESEESEDQYSDSESDYCDDDIKKQVRESLHRTHIHSMHRPLQEQTHFKQTMNQEEDSDEESQVDDYGGRGDEIAEADDKYSGNQQEVIGEEEGEYSEDNSECDHQDNGMSLGNTIARMDRRIKGEPTPSKEGTPPEVLSRSRKMDYTQDEGSDINDDVASSKDAKTDQFVNEDNIHRSTKRFGTPKHSLSPVSKVLDFEADNSDSVNENLLDAKKQEQVSFDMTNDQIQMQPKLAPLTQQSVAMPMVHQPIMQAQSQFQSFQQTHHEGSNDNLITKTLLHSFDQIDNYDRKADDSKQQFTSVAAPQEQKSESYPEPSSSEELNQELQQIMDQEESDHPNVLTEEVTNDRRILDDDEVNQFTVDLTPCSEHNTQSLLDNNHRNIKTRSFGQVAADDFSQGKQSVHSILTSNDKYSVADKRSSRKSSLTSEKNETGKFGTVGSAISAFPINNNELSVKHLSVSKVAANEGTFGNVSFGDADDGQGGPDDRQQHKDDLLILFAEQQLRQEASQLAQARETMGQGQSYQIPEPSHQPSHHHPPLETREEPILLFDRSKKQQNHQNQQAAMFASQAQLPSQQTYDAGEFSSSQNNIQQNGTGHFSSFNTQKSAQQPGSNMNTMQNNNLYNQQQQQQYQHQFGSLPSSQQSSFLPHNMGQKHSARGYKAQQQQSKQQHYQHQHNQQHLTSMISIAQSINIVSNSNYSNSVVASSQQQPFSQRQGSTQQQTRDTASVIMANAQKQLFNSQRGQAAVPGHQGAQKTQTRPYEPYKQKKATLRRSFLTASRSTNYSRNLGSQSKKVTPSNTQQQSWQPNHNLQKKRTHAEAFPGGAGETDGGAGLNLKEEKNHNVVDNAHHKQKAFASLSNIDLPMQKARRPIAKRMRVAQQSLTNHSHTPTIPIRAKDQQQFHQKDQQQYQRDIPSDELLFSDSVPQQQKQ